MVKTGIYLITNLITDKNYVGQSKHIYRRWRDHKNPNNWDDKPLYRAFKKYGIANFKFSILEECSVTELNDKEIYWISYYDSFNNGYNLTAGGDSNGHYIKLSTELVLAIIKDLQGTELTGNELALKYDVNKDMISHINNGKCWKQPGISYPIRKICRQVYTCASCGCEVSKKALLCMHCLTNVKHTNSPIQLSKEELAKLIYETNFSAVGKLFNMSDNGVRRVCVRLGLPTHTKEVKQWYIDNCSPDSLTE